MTNLAVAIVRNALIAAAILCLPVYGLWCFGGHLADRAGQKRDSA